MNKQIHIIILLIVLTACNSNKEKNTRSDSSAIDKEKIDTVKLESADELTNNEINTLNLQKSFIEKDGTQFLNQFPKDFHGLKTYFGWDTTNDKPQKLYEEANDYIDYWFDLLNNEKYKAYEKNIIRICTDGHWLEDAINYFQDKSLTYFKKNKKYSLINELNNDEANSVLFFLFDGPTPQFDEDFASNLIPTKRKILDDLFETGFFDDNENPDPFPDEEEIETNTYTFSDYSNNDVYFIKEIDINKDGTLDKITSHKQYEGEELLLFIKEKDNFKFALKTINFSEDGGNQIRDIKETETGFMIETFFPDGGFLESHHYISFINNKWILTNTIFKTKSSNQKDAFMYICDVKQDIDIADSEFLIKLKSIPDETERDKVCVKESIRTTENTTQILLPTIYRDWENKNPADHLNKDWFDLHKLGDAYSLSNPNYNITTGQDECSGALTKTIISNNKTLLFINNKNLKLGEINSINFNKNKIWPNEKLTLNYNNIEYTLRAEGNIISTENVQTDTGLERFSEVENYKLYISTNNTTEVLFLEEQSFNDTFVKLLFVGDIDSDGKLDFIFEANRFYEELRVILYLSSEAKNEEIIKKSDEVTIGFGC